MITVILQARMSSTRLPGKVLRKIMGRPMLEWQLERIARAQLVDQIVIATSTDASDDPLEAFCERIGMPYCRGPLDDVLERYFRAHQKFGGDPIVRLTGDCPLVDPIMIDRVIAFHRQNGNDYTSNVHPQTFPDGLDVEVFSAGALRRAQDEAQLPSHREHVTFYFTDNPDLFKLGGLTGDLDLSKLRWTVDYPEDFEMVRQVFEALAPDNRTFATDEILTLLERRPDLAALNAEHEPGEGWVSAFERDKEFLK
jgi:spore coat polysaccharide biosynthesis protein SpsF (cytidylyltransferase family)